MDRNNSSTSVVPMIFDEGTVIDIPLRFDQPIPKKLTDQVSILKNFLKSCLELVENEDALVELSSLIEELEVFDGKIMSTIFIKY